MSFIIIIGIILVAVGSIVTYYGSKKDSDKSQEIIVGEINKFRLELNTVKNEPTIDLEKVSKLDELANEFDDWATHLKENYPEIKLSLKKLELELSEKEINLSKEWKLFYLEIFQNIDKMIASINKGLNAEKKLTVSKIGSFPQSLFSNEDDDYFWMLKFDEHNLWKISLRRFRINQNESTLPLINILYTNAEKIKSGLAFDEFTLHFKPESVKCLAKGYFRFIDTEKFSEELNISNVNEILKTCLQYQLVKISHK